MDFVPVTTPDPAEAAKRASFGSKSSFGDDFDYQGHTEKELTSAFGAVMDAEHWKYPIDRTFVALGHAQRRVIEDAVIFYAGCVPDFIDNPDGTVTVSAEGYYSAVGS